MHIKKTVQVVPVLLVLSSSFNSYAEEGKHGLLLNSTITLAHDDNILKNSNNIKDEFLSVEPIALFNSSIGKHDVTFQYSGEFVVYNDNSDFNHNNHDLSSGITLDHSQRMSTEFGLFYQNKSEKPNSTDAVSLNNTEFNRFNQKGLTASWLYGKVESTGQIVLSYTHADKNYTNNQQSFRDLKENSLSGTFFYKLSDLSRLLFLAQAQDFDYQNTSINDQSSKQYSALTGFVWQTSTTTSGEFKIGYQSKQYENADFGDINGLTYMLDMKWKPQIYTDITFGSSRSTNESALENQQGFTSTSYFFDIAHNLTKRTDVDFGIQYDISDLGQQTLNGESQNRKDKASKANIGITHSLRKWLNISLTYTYEKRSSINTLFDFDSNIIAISLETNFE